MASLGEIDKHGREQTGLKATKRIVEKAALRPGEGCGRTDRVCDVVRAMLVAKDMRTVGAIAEALRALQTDATTLRPGDRGATFHNYSKSVVKTVSRPHPHAHLP